MFWPTFSTPGSSSSGFSFAIAFLSGIWPGQQRRLAPHFVILPIAAQVERALCLAARRAMGERQIGGAALARIDVAPRAVKQGKRDADQARIVGIERVGLAVEGHGAGLGGLGDPFVEQLLVLDQLVVGLLERLVDLRGRSLGRRGFGGGLRRGRCCVGRRCHWIGRLAQFLGVPGDQALEALLLQPRQQYVGIGRASCRTPRARPASVRCGRAGPVAGRCGSARRSAPATRAAWAA